MNGAWIAVLNVVENGKIHVGRVRVTIEIEKRKEDRNENERNMNRERSIRANAGRREEIEKAYSLLSW
ncbi:hypothetical protein K0M31_009105 [Melipona bicolor]|uniref:Uncharacterized protein n=1 Tax=Melipona bicolor TaxID=60889 RepID=A0AA40KJJ4_9HYME|nr:hypothetical protein K0M31_009105 [Melipona bicolor]